jgi:hypothetical protein
MIQIAREHSQPPPGQPPVTRARLAAIADLDANRFLTKPVEHWLQT